MTQSKNNIMLDDLIDLGSSDNGWVTNDKDYTFTLSDTVDLDNITITTGALTADYTIPTIIEYIDPSRVEKMCQTYPALEKVWRNFKSVYDMVDQDYRGNHEDDDEIPF